MFDWSASPSIFPGSCIHPLVPPSQSPHLFSLMKHKHCTHSWELRGKCYGWPFLLVCRAFSSAPSRTLSHVLPVHLPATVRALQSCCWRSDIFFKNCHFEDYPRRKVKINIIASYRPQISFTSLLQNCQMKIISVYPNDNIYSHF